MTRSEGTATEAAAQQLDRSIKALTLPPGGAADVEQLDALFDEALVNQRSVVNDEIAHDKRAFTVDFAKEQKLGEQRTTLERKLGATACVGAE